MLGPGLGGAELIVIAVIALIVVGPKDLPVLLRKVGRFMGKMRAMATDFRASFDEMARQSELDDLRKEVQALRDGGLVDKWAAPAQSAFDDIDSSLRAAPRPFAPAEPAPDLLPPGSADGMTALPPAEPAPILVSGEHPDLQPPTGPEPARAARPFAPAPERSEA